jgi:predicted ATPase
MLTRIEIDGFKTFREFCVDLLPFQVILGPNAVGKSNLFDALRLLSRLAETDLHTAFQDTRGEPREMFAVSGPDESVESMSFAVEVLLDPIVRDPWGVEVRPKHTRVRYELSLARRNGRGGVERLYVTAENAKPIPDRKDSWVKQIPSKQFRDIYVKRGRRSPWLETKDADGVKSFEIAQDGRAGRTRPADSAESTILSGVTSAEFPHLYALREELRSWRFLHLNPEGLRQPSPSLSPDRLLHDGRNLATVLARIRNETRTEDRPAGVIPDVSATLAQLVPGVRSIEIAEDERKKEYRIDIGMQDGHTYPSRVLSDGTLRLLALVALMNDPRERGLLCFEEPENGVHPFRLGQLIETMRLWTSDLHADDSDPDDPDLLRQVLLNSHSPVVLNNLDKSLTLFADTISYVDPTGEQRTARCTRLRRVEPSLFESTEGTVTSSYVKNVLETAWSTGENAQ